MEGKRNSEEGWGGVASQGLFSGGSEIGELLETTNWASVEQAKVYQLFHFQKKTYCCHW